MGVMYYGLRQYQRSGRYQDYARINTAIKGHKLYLKSLRKQIGKEQIRATKERRRILFTETGRYLKQGHLLKAMRRWFTPVKWDASPTARVLLHNLDTNARTLFLASAYGYKHVGQLEALPPRRELKAAARKVRSLSECPAYKQLGGGHRASQLASHTRSHDQ